jgi:hypothetical protein
VKSNKPLILVAVLLVLLYGAVGGAVPRLLASPAGSALAQTLIGSAFTYQGHLRDGGNPANGSYDLEFRLFDAPELGNELGSITQDDVQVLDDLFAARLDFGTGAFDGEARYLKIGVRPGADTGAYTVLAPPGAASRASLCWPKNLSAW